MTKYPTIYRLIAGIGNKLVLLFLLMSVQSVAFSETFELDELDQSGAVDLKLYVFDCGEILVRDLSLFNAAIPQGTHKVFADACYLIVHPKGTLLWDAGLSDAVAEQPGGVDVPGGVFHLSVTNTLVSQLEDLAIDPLTIDYVAFSHLHFDHTGNAQYFLNSTWLIQKPEFDVAFGPDAEAHFFDPSTYEMLKGNEKVIQGHYDVFGDKSVVILSTPGHTPGHQALFLNLPETGPTVLSGDLYHFLENRNNYGVPVFNSTIRETIHSFVLVDNVLDQLDAKLWIQHDKPFFETLKLAPAFYQ